MLAGRTRGFTARLPALDIFERRVVGKHFPNLLHCSLAASMMGALYAGEGKG
jgi:hypothetical protein